MAARRCTGLRILPASMLRSLLPAVLICPVLPSPDAAADTYPRQPGVDAIHYVFRLTITDASNEIAGECTATFRMAADGVREVFLDLASVAQGKGMTVSGVDGCRRSAAVHAHRRPAARSRWPRQRRQDSEVEVTVRYRGVPADGLRLIDNMHGERTIFSESWPDRGRQWLPMIDHPYDKATGEFIVTAPAHYQVVANGLLLEEVDLPGGVRRTHWKQSVPIASWLYARRDRTVCHAPLRCRSRRPPASMGVPAGCGAGLSRLRVHRPARLRVLQRLDRAVLRTRSSRTSRLPGSTAAWNRRRRSCTARKASRRGVRPLCTKSPTSGGATPSPRATGTTCG